MGHLPRLSDRIVLLLLVIGINALLASTFLGWISRPPALKHSILLSRIGVSLVFIGSALVILAIFKTTRPDFQFRVGLRELLIYLTITAATLGALRFAYEWGTTSWFILRNKNSLKAHP